MRRAAESLASQVAATRGNTEAVAAVLACYRDVDADVSRLPVRCMGGGCCCRFELAGHRLYVSTLELAVLLREAPPNLACAWMGGCPYQIGPRCMARASRPLGCRTFFCGDDETALQEIHESRHSHLRNIHESLRVPYSYVPLPEGVLNCL